MKISENGIAFLRGREGERLTGYADSRGIPTIGVGHTGTVEGKPVSIGMHITEQQSDELLRVDLQAVENLLTETITVPLTQNQFDALCSLVFNIGCAAFEHSEILARLNSGDYVQAAEAILMWSRAGDNSDLLLPRRKSEKELFLS